MNEPKSQSWWHTVPGMLTGAAAIITAVSGLLLAISQAGWLKRDTSETANVAETQTAPGNTSDAKQIDSKGSNGAPTMRLVPEMNEVKVGTGVFTLLGVTTERRTADQAGMRIRIRLLNDSPYPVNFWNDNFRLQVDGVPRAPVGDLNKIVAGHAAEEGDVDFNFPVNAAALVLTVRYYGEEATIQLQPVSN